MSTLLAAAGVAFGVTVLLARLCVPLARRIGLVDRPGGHRAHRDEVPLVGGIAMFCGFLFGVLLLDTGLHDFRPLFAAAALLVIVGVLDDFQEVTPPGRLAAQAAAALLMLGWGGIGLHDLGALLGPVPLALGGLGPAFTLFTVIGVINAVNMLDGADGLAGGAALIALSLLAVAALASGLWAATGAGTDAGAPARAAAVLLVLAAAIAGFLLFNLRYPGHPQASLFMGDAGSMFLGLALAWFLIGLSQGPGRVIAPVSALWLLALPLADTVCIIARRSLAGRSPFRADRRHLHHLLQALGLTHGQSVALLLGASLGLGLIGLGAPALGVAEHWLFFAFCGLFVGFCAGIALGWRAVARRATVAELNARPGPKRRSEADARR